MSERAENVAQKNYLAKKKVLDDNPKYKVNNGVATENTDEYYDALLDALNVRNKQIEAIDSLFNLDPNYTTLPDEVLIEEVVTPTGRSVDQLKADRHNYVLNNSTLGKMDYKGLIKAIQGKGESYSKVNHPANPKELTEAMKAELAPQFGLSKEELDDVIAKALSNYIAKNAKDVHKTTEKDMKLAREFYVAQLDGDTDKMNAIKKQLGDRADYILNENTNWYDNYLLDNLANTYLLGKVASMAYPSAFNHAREIVKSGEGDLDGRDWGADLVTAGLTTVNPFGKGVKWVGGKLVPKALEKVGKSLNPRHIGTRTVLSNGASDMVEGMGEEAVRQGISNEDMDLGGVVGAGAGNGVVGGAGSLATVLSPKKGVGALVRTGVKGFNKENKKQEVLRDIGKKFGEQEDALKVLNDPNAQPSDVGKLLRTNEEYIKADKEAKANRAKAESDYQKVVKEDEAKAKENEKIIKENAEQYAKADAEYEARLQELMEEADENTMRWAKATRTDIHSGKFKDKLYDNRAKAEAEFNRENGLVTNYFQRPDNMAEYLEAKKAFKEAENAVPEAKGKPQTAKVPKAGFQPFGEPVEFLLKEYQRGWLNGKPVLATKKADGTFEPSLLLDEKRAKAMGFDEAQPMESYVSGGYRIDPNTPTKSHKGAKIIITRVPKLNGKYMIPNKWFDEKFKTLLDESDDLNGGAWKREDVIKYAEPPIIYKTAKGAPPFEVVKEINDHGQVKQYGYVEGKPSMRVINNRGEAGKPITLSAEERTKWDLEEKPAPEKPKFDPTNWEHESDPLFKRKSNQDVILTTYKNLGEEPAPSPYTWNPGQKPIAKGNEDRLESARKRLEEERQKAIDSINEKRKAHTHPRDQYALKVGDANQKPLNTLDGRGHDEFLEDALDVRYNNETGEMVHNNGDPKLILEIKHNRLGRDIADRGKKLTEEVDKSINQRAKYGDVYTPDKPTSDNEFTIDEDRAKLADVYREKKTAGDITGWNDKGASASAGLYDMGTRAGRNVGANFFRTNKEPTYTEEEPEVITKAKKAVKSHVTKNKPKAKAEEIVIEEESSIRTPWGDEGREPTWEEKQTPLYHQWKLDQLIHGNNGHFEVS